MNKYLVIILLFTTSYSYASPVDTVETFSPSMKKTIKAVVIKPSDYKKAKALPVVYLLHGYSGNYTVWIKRVPELQQYADQHDILIVCPDGDYNSWYLDSPQDSLNLYETYISTELVDWVDQHYKTIPSPKGRGISGLSMGGHGALYLAFRNQDVFGVAGSMSGGVDLRPFPNNWDLSKKLGAYAEFPDRWERHSVINLTHLLNPGGLSFIIDCGIDDFFYDVNLNLHNKLLERNIPHDFISRPGKHNWDYWRNAVKYQLLFMDNFFIRELGK